MMKHIRNINVHHFSASVQSTSEFKQKTFMLKACEQLLPATTLHYDCAAFAAKSSTARWAGLVAGWRTTVPSSSPAVMLHSMYRTECTDCNTPQPYVLAQTFRNCKVRYHKCQK